MMLNVECEYCPEQVSFHYYIQVTYGLTDNVIQISSRYRYDAVDS